MKFGQHAFLRALHAAIIHCHHIFMLSQPWVVNKPLKTLLNTAFTTQLFVVSQWAIHFTYLHWRSVMHLWSFFVIGMLEILWWWWWESIHLQKKIITWQSGNQYVQVLTTVIIKSATSDSTFIQSLGITAHCNGRFFVPHKYSCSLTHSVTHVTQNVYTAKLHKDAVLPLLPLPNLSSSDTAQ